MRVISWVALNKLYMADRAFGWTVEMQVRALKQGLRVLEIDVPYHRRTAGKSKVSRTVIGTVKAGITILWVIGREFANGLQQKSQHVEQAAPVTISEPCNKGD
jgi:hypothetical protein